MRRIKTLALALSSFAIIGVFSSSAARAQTYGFDYIGTDENAYAGQKCISSFIDASGGYRRLITAWTPPSSGNPNVIYQYSPTTFRSVIGLTPQDSPHPSGHMNWALYVYDSFENFRADPNNNFRILMTFDVGSPSITYADAPNCIYTAGWNTFAIPCWHLTLNTTAPSSVEYRTATGQPTSIPQKLLGGTRYWFSLVGYNSNPQDGIACVVRTNYQMPAQYSPIPEPAISFPMVYPEQCAEAGLTYPCDFPLAHQDFYKTDESAAQCDEYRTPVNWLNSPYNPLLNPSPWGHLPRTCGGATESPCCERTFGGRSAYALTGTRSTLKRLLATSTLAAKATPVHLCREPNC